MRPFQRVPNERTGLARRKLRVTSIDPIRLALHFDWASHYVRASSISRCFQAVPAALYEECVVFFRDLPAAVSVAQTRCDSVETIENIQSEFGGASRARTDDLIVANDALSQLSYSPARRMVD